MDFIVRFTWYDDERIWISSIVDDRISLTLDCGSFDGLLEKVKIILYDMIENDLGYTGDVNLKIETQRVVNMNIEAKA